MARLISTLLLLKTNYPPLIIEADEKEKYFEALIKSETQPEQEAIVHFFIKKMILNLSKNVNKRKSRLRK
jgi:Fic family protein